MIDRIVTGPVVVLPDSTTGKTTYYYQGAVLPDGLDKDRVADVIASGLVSEVERLDRPTDNSDGDQIDGQVAGDQSGEVPTGSAEEVLTWVGDDTDRARAALAAEQAASKPRTTLVDKLTKLADQA